jgi:organic hydroperoxide reductase OsmC/OhrA
MNAVAPQVGVTMPKNTEDSIVESKVHLVGSLEQLDMGLRVSMKVSVKGLSKEELEKVVAKAKEICPYSRATQGNVPTDIAVEVLN